MADGLDVEFEKEVARQQEELGDESSSDSEIDKYVSLHSAVCKKRLFGRDKPLHVVLGGGQQADIILWRKKLVSGSVVIAATCIWFLFECVGYHLLTFLCHSLILSLSILFLWSNFTSFFNVSPPELPKVSVPEHLVLTLSRSLSNQLNQGAKILKDVASGGRDLKKFLRVILALWLLSIFGSWFSLLTLLYLVLMTLLTVPMLYEKHEDTVDAYAGKGLVELKKQYDILDEKYLQKLRSSILHNRRQQH